MNFHGGDVYGYSGDMIDFSSNINPLGVPDSFRRLLIERLDDFTRYPDIEYREVKEQIADYIDICEIGHIIPGNGAVELIYKLVAASGMERVYGLRPTFSEYGRAAKAAGLEYFDIPAFNSDYAAVDMEVLISSIKPKSMVIICNPNNPTGTLTSKDRMIQLAEALEKLDCKLIIDEAFIEFTDNYPHNSMVGSLEEFINTTVIRAATKFFGMPGIRLGYAVTADTGTANAVKELMEPWNLNTSAVIAASSVFMDKGYIEKSRTWIKTEREYLYEKLGGFGEFEVYPSAANFHLLKLEEDTMTAAQLKLTMTEYGVLIRTAEGFGGLTEFHFRLAVKSRSSNEKLIKTLKEIFKL